MADRPDWVGKVDSDVTIVAAEDLDIRDLVYATDSVTAYQGGTWSFTVDKTKIWDGADYLAVNADGSINATVVVTEVKVWDGTDYLAVNADGSINAAVTGTFWQETQPVSGTFWQGTQPVSATDLDIRNLSSATDSISSVQSGAWSVTIQEPLSVDDNGGSLTVDGTVGTELNTDDLDTGAGTDTQAIVGIALPASGGHVLGGTSTNPIKIDPTGTTTQPVSDAGSSLTVDATDLDIRDLSSATDEVKSKVWDGTDYLAINADGSINTTVAVTETKIWDGTDYLAVNADGSINAVVSATNLDIRDLSSAQDNVAARGYGYDGSNWQTLNTDQTNVLRVESDEVYSARNRTKVIAKLDAVNNAVVDMYTVPDGKTLYITDVWMHAHTQQANTQTSAWVGESGGDMFLYWNVYDIDESPAAAVTYTMPLKYAAGTIIRVGGGTYARVDAGIAGWIE